jgi:protein-S-isoprenylcysteine O-methyltransferase Ste14
MVLTGEIASEFGMWWAALAWIVIFGVFILFVPFYKKSQIKPAGTYIAFVVALAIEMFGVPLSMYALGWAFGIWLPEGVLWGHTLGQYIGLWGMYIGIIIMLTGIALVIVGWKQIHKEYWSKESGQGHLVKTGIYGYIRHPQYIGFYLVTFGMLLEWATIPLIILYVLLVFLYYGLAKREEKDMEKEFGSEYTEYKKHTKMFVPYVI